MNQAPRDPHEPHDPHNLHQPHDPHDSQGTRDPLAAQASRASRDPQDEQALQPQQESQTKQIPFALKGAITPRIYQQRIFVKATAGNTLVVLPTGLGKTLIAAMLAVFKLNQNPGSKVVFLAPTKPLVEQHGKTFAGCTTIDPARLVILTGDTDADKRGEAWRQATVCFMTPQTFQNDIEKGLYAVDDISLLVLDEAHRAVGEYAYCAIARYYKEHAASPHVLAMTASPGATMEQIDGIKQALFIEHVEVRDEQDPDVKPYVHDTKTEWKHVDLPAEFIGIIKSLEEEHDKVITFIKEKKLVPEDRFNSINRKDMLGVNARVAARLKTCRDQQEKSDLFSILKILAVGLRLSHALELIETQGATALLKYLEDADEKSRSPEASGALRIFVDLVYQKNVLVLTRNLVNAGISHPKISILTNIVTDFLRNHPESRVIVFANFRVTVAMIVSELKVRGIDKVERFIGQQSSGREKGMTQKKQSELIDRFHGGEIQVLVATSVAEEGLDIGEVDMVVFYDVVPSAIRTIQRRGRTGRKRKGKVIVLVAKNTRDESYYHAEKNKEKRMRATLKEMKDGPPPTLDAFKK
ncbi:MAG: DEAD/DEAH box helicase family protein [Candidatus Lokiarchaeota archaeon]|nr:DEAD/DEAH box helicase family protein [Candidatus Lokiarchaeota archaeon]